jgi:hypothetical protein
MSPTRRDGQGEGAIEKLKVSSIPLEPKDPLLAFSRWATLGFHHNDSHPAFESELKAGLFASMPKKQTINLEKVRGVAQHPLYEVRIFDPSAGDPSRGFLFRRDPLQCFHRRPLHLEPRMRVPLFHSVRDVACDRFGSFFGNVSIFQ